MIDYIHPVQSSINAGIRTDERPDEVLNRWSAKSRLLFVGGLLLLLVITQLIYLLLTACHKQVMRNVEPNLYALQDAYKHK